MIPLVDHYQLRQPVKVAFREKGQLYELRDVLRQADERLKDAKSKGEIVVPTLEIHGAASHSGKIINNRSYPGKRVRKATPTWVTPYPKPFQRHHRSGTGGSIFGGDDTEDPLGRVVKATYVQFVDGPAFDNDDVEPLANGTGDGGHCSTHAVLRESTLAITKPSVIHVPRVRVS